MAKIYTKTGDEGSTGLFGGKRVSKADLRIDSYGTLDELNSYMGLIATFDVPCISADFIHTIQSILFDIGAHLATDPAKEMPLPEIKSGSISDLEGEIDKMDAQLPALTYFILPGGTAEASHCQIARSLCRRTERKMVALHDVSPIHPLSIQYINRLSDYLFVLARKVVYDQGAKEIPWKPQK